MVQTAILLAHMHSGFNLLIFFCILPFWTYIAENQTSNLSRPLQCFKLFIWFWIEAIYIILESDVAGDTFTIGFGREHIYNSWFRCCRWHLHHHHGRVRVSTISTQPPRPWSLSLSWGRGCWVSPIIKEKFKGVTTLTLLWWWVKVSLMQLIPETNSTRPLFLLSLLQFEHLISNLSKNVIWKRKESLCISIW